MVSCVKPLTPKGLGSYDPLPDHGRERIYWIFQELKYPMSVFLIVANEFCERFSYYGMKSNQLQMFPYIM